MIRIENITLRVPTMSLEDISFKIQDHEYFILLGPTGAGKSLFLDIIAGAYLPDEGHIFFDDEDITLKSPESRKIGYVPQDYSLFNNMSVKDNITFGLRVRGLYKAEAEKKVIPLIKTLDLEKLLNKRPEVLSGGEIQKVAIARALATEPKLLILDEPLTSLDQNIKQKFTYELKRIHKEYGLTTIHVTHDPAEALELADRIGVINNGKLVQIGDYNSLIESPKNEFIAKFMGLNNVVKNNELNKKLGIEENDMIAFKSDDVVLSDEGFEVAVEQIIKIGPSFMVIGYLLGQKIDIKITDNINMSQNSIKIKIKKFTKILC
jgi:molybdate/tungstate transport system ATP-binding protein